jgi:GT2 family glycosyltransferase
LRERREAIQESTPTLNGRTQQKISVIIVNYCTRELLADCVHSIQSNSDQQVEVIVVDNDSNDGSVEMIRAEFPQVELIANSENVGFAKANNQGIQKAKGRFILLLNSDTIVRPQALRVMGEFLETHPETGAVTCRLLNRDGSAQASISKRPSPMLLLFRISGLSRLFRTDRTRRFLRKYFGFLLGSTVRSYLDPYTASGPLEVENISGACLMLRREAIEQVGLLDESFFMYFEDMDYCMRLQDAGWKLYYVPTGEIVHLVGQSSGGRMRNYSLHSYQSLFLFYRKYYSSITVMFIRSLVLIASLIQWMWMVVRTAFSNQGIYRQNRDDLAQVIRFCVS